MISEKNEDAFDNANNVEKGVTVTLMNTQRQKKKLLEEQDSVADYIGDDEDPNLVVENQIESKIKVIEVLK